MLSYSALLVFLLLPFSVMPRHLDLSAPFAACAPRRSRRSSQRMLWLFLLPLQVVVLLILHFCFAFSRLVVLLRQLPSFNRDPPTSSPLSPTVAEIEEARRSWRKTPKKLAVLFAVGRRWDAAFWRRGSKNEEEQVEVAKLASDIGRLVKWSDQLGIQELSLYDERGGLALLSFLKPVRVAHRWLAACRTPRPPRPSHRIIPFRLLHRPTAPRRLPSRLSELPRRHDPSPTRQAQGERRHVSNSGRDRQRLWCIGIWRRRCALLRPSRRAPC